MEMPDTLPVPLTKPDLQDRAEELGIKYFIPCISSLNLGTRGTIIPRSAIRKVQQNGFGIVGFEFGLEFDDCELMLIPDPSTLIQLPWKKEYAWITCYAYFKGKAFAACPRRLLQQQIKRLDDHGYIMKSGFEVEFILLKKDKLEPTDTAELSKSLYLDPHSQMRNSKLITQILDMMDELGWGPYQAEKEFAVGQYEINYKYTTAMEAADRFLFLKFAIKELAAQSGVRATFMPLVVLGVPDTVPLGTGLHINCSLWSKTDDVGLMGDEKGREGMSDLCQNFTAGIVKHMPALTAFACPTPNSFKRLHVVPNMMGIKSWAVDNKWPPVRVATEDNIANRIEFRLPDCSCNPYVVQAAMIAAGLDGIENKIELQEKERLKHHLFGKEKPEGIEDLPKYQEEALGKLEADEVLGAALGEELLGGFMKIKYFSLMEYHKQITPYETEHCDVY